MVEYRLERLMEANAATWEDFNIRSPDGSFYHSLVWQRLISKTADKVAQNFLLIKNEDVVGLLPFVERRIRSFRGLGPVSDPQRLCLVLGDRTGPDCMHAVLKELQALDGRPGPLDFVCLSTLHRETLDTITSHRAYPYAEKGDMVLDLAKTPPGAVWDSFSAKKGQRKFIRRFEENGFEITEVRSLRDLELFWRYYAENMRHIGGTLLPFPRFVDIFGSLSGDVRITLLAKGPIFAGGLLMFRYPPRSTVYLAYLSINRDLPNTYSPSYYLWWEAINWAWNNGYRRISFGQQYEDRSNPRFRIKQDLGASFEPIHSRIVPLSGFFAAGMRGKEFLSRWHTHR